MSCSSGWGACAGFSQPRLPGLPWKLPRRAEGLPLVGRGRDGCTARRRWLHRAGECLETLPSSEKQESGALGLVQSRSLFTLLTCRGTGPVREICAASLSCSALSSVVSSCRVTLALP